MSDKKTLYIHEKNEHTAHIPHDPVAKHKKDLKSGNAIQQFNTRIAFSASTATSSVWCFYFFLVVSGSGFPGIPWINCTPQQFVAWFSSQFLQLILLPLIAYVAAQVGKRQDKMSEEMYHTAMKTYHDTEQLIKHLDAQDGKIIAIEEQNAEQINLIKQLLIKLAA